MKRFAGFGFLMLLAGAVWADANADAKAHSDAFARAMKARDVAAVVALYADDAYVIWPGAGQEAHGKAAIEKLVADFMKDPQSAPTLKSQNVVDLGNGSIAVIGQWEQVVTGADGKSQTITVRTSEIIRKVGNKTLYVVDHASVGVPAATTP
jgi:uncharacterized protein (TIGR02246 family)